MRFNPESENTPDEESDLHLAGSLALAHPALQDPNFARSVVLVTAHSADDGTLGVIVNRPLGKTVKDFDPSLAETTFADVPLYSGGPVGHDQLIVTAWRWNPEEGSFRLYFGIDESKAQSLLLEDPELELRAFLGHSGWGEGQIEGELEEGSWVITPLQPDIDTEEGPAVWRSILARVSPEMRLLADEPDDPSIN